MPNKADLPIILQCSLQSAVFLTPVVFTQGPGRWSVTGEERTSPNVQALMFGRTTSDWLNLKAESFPYNPGVVAKLPLLATSGSGQRYVSYEA